MYISGPSSFHGYLHSAQMFRFDSPLSTYFAWFAMLPGEWYADCRWGRNGRRSSASKAGRTSTEWNYKKLHSIEMLQLDASSHCKATNKYCVDLMETCLRCGKKPTLSELRRSGEGFCLNNLSNISHKLCLHFSHWTVSHWCASIQLAHEAVKHLSFRFTNTVIRCDIYFPSISHVVGIANFLFI